MELFDAIRSDASVEGRLDLVRDKVRQGADVNATNEDGWPALVSACVHGHVEVAEHLALRGAKHSYVHLKLDAWKLWMIAVKGKDWPFLSQSPFDVVLSHFVFGTSSRGNQRSKDAESDAFTVVKECLSDVGLELHLKKENWRWKARARSAPEWKLFKSWQVVFDSGLMPLFLRVLPQTSQFKSGFAGFEFECIWKRDSNPDFGDEWLEEEEEEEEYKRRCHDRGDVMIAVIFTREDVMIAVMKSIDFWHALLREGVFWVGWVTVCVSGCVFLYAVCWANWEFWVRIVVCVVLFLLCTSPPCVYFMYICVFVVGFCVYGFCMVTLYRGGGLYEEEEGERRARREEEEGKRRARRRRRRRQRRARRGAPRSVVL
jgi:hypothetical protein